MTVTQTTASCVSVMPTWTTKERKSHQGIDHYIHERGKEASLSAQLLMRISDRTAQDPP